MERNDSWFSIKLPLKVLSVVSIMYPWIFMTPLINLYIQVYICDEEGFLNNCNAFYYPVICIFTGMMIVLVVGLSMLFICTSFENFFKIDALARIPAPIDYSLIWLRIFIIITDLFIDVFLPIFSL